MVSLDNITIRFGGEALFSKVSFMIDKNDKLGLVGKNGAGKSTLLKTLVGIQEPSEGGVSVTRGIEMGYLPQTMQVVDDNTVIEETRKAFSKHNELEKKIAKLSNELADRSDYESESYNKLITELTSANEAFDMLGGNNLEGEMERTLKGLGFLRSDFDRPTGEFSGGWRMRIELAKLLLQKPELLLLDEPTNHLDIESIEWLEQVLKNYRGAIVLISHDKRFLDNVTTRTVEIALGKIQDYKVPYSQYRILRAERYEQEMAAYRNQQKMIEETEKFIERFRYKATKAVQVQSRIKQLEKLDRLVVDEEDKASLHFSFQPAPRSGSISVKTKNFTKAYGEHIILDQIDFELSRGEKVSFVGKNGEGKSTFAKAIVGELSHTGKINLGHNVQLGYYAQEQDKLMDEDKTVFETLDDIAVGDMRTKVRDILGAFLFGGESVDKKVKVLSGGERSRLAMAKLLLQPYNLLVLDEPTNHLDMRSKEVLKQALVAYDGSMIVVSHDRDFLDGLTDLVYEFKDRKLKQYSGGIEYFLQKKRLENMHDFEKPTASSIQEEKTENASENKERHLQRKEIDKKLRKVKNDVKSAETQIEQLEAEIEDYGQKLSNPETENLTQDFFNEYENKKKALDSLMEKWENLTHEQEQLENEREQL